MADDAVLRESVDGFAVFSSAEPIPAELDLSAIAWAPKEEDAAEAAAAAAAIAAEAVAEEVGSEEAGLDEEDAPAAEPSAPSQEPGVQQPAAADSEPDADSPSESGTLAPGSGGVSFEEEEDDDDEDDEEDAEEEAAVATKAETEWQTLYLACRHGQIGSVRYLLERGANANYVTSKGPTVLMYASLLGYAVIMRLLLEAGADVLAQCTRGHTALSHSSRLEVVQLLCAYGARRVALRSDAPADAHAWVLGTSRWSTQLHHLKLISPARVRQLLAGGADVRASDGGGNDAPTPSGSRGARLVLAAAAP
ncbi:ankyrin repeat-containing domain protein [Pavlovales sp. CCMP2436]|nr:ankyrin repeat-containing domain protein [Pavlovales sp. CCMP2436]